MNIVLYEPAELHADAISLLQEAGYNVIHINDKYTPFQIDGIFVRTYTRVTKELLDRYPNMKFVLRAGVGLDNIDVDLCKKRGIAIYNSPGSNSNAVAELVILSMLSLLRNVDDQRSSLQNGTWRKKEYIGQEVSGKVIGIVGCGHIGRLVAQKLHGFSVSRIIGYDPYIPQEQLTAYRIQKVSFDELLAQSDSITIHIPLIDETKDLFNSQSFSKMKKGSILINTSRGGIVNENDLLAALTSGHIHGAALDVFENEPVVNTALLNNPRIFATPHIGAYTAEADRAMCVQAVEHFLKAQKEIHS